MRPAETLRAGLRKLSVMRHLREPGTVSVTTRHEIAEMLDAYENGDLDELLKAESKAA